MTEQQQSNENIAEVATESTNLTSTLLADVTPEIEKTPAVVSGESKVPDSVTTEYVQPPKQPEQPKVRREKPQHTHRTDADRRNNTPINSGMADALTAALSKGRAKMPGGPISLSAHNVLLNRETESREAGWPSALLGAAQPEGSLLTVWGGRAPLLSLLGNGSKLKANSARFMAYVVARNVDGRVAYGLAGESKIRMSKRQLSVGDSLTEGVVVLRCFAYGTEEQLNSASMFELREVKSGAAELRPLM